MLQTISCSSICWWFDLNYDFLSCCKTCQKHCICAIWICQEIFFGLRLQYWLSLGHQWLHVLDQYNSPWNQAFLRLVKFIDLYFHCIVCPKSFNRCPWSTNLILQTNSPDSFLATLPGLENLAWSRKACRKIKCLKKCLLLQLLHLVYGFFSLVYYDCGFDKKPVQVFNVVIAALPTILNYANLSGSTA